jgi:hypothetical protein
MSMMIAQNNLSFAWLKSLNYLIEQGGRAVNLATVIKQPAEEDENIRRVVDRFIADQRQRAVKFADIDTVADLIFPASYYHPKLGNDARTHLYKMEEIAFRKIRQQPSYRSGTYFHRLVAWPTGEQPLNQIERVIRRIESETARDNPKSSIYELAIYHPELDRTIMGFPCLSYMSLTLLDGRLHMTALYRNQHFIRKAYGNYVGLARLLQFICDESKCQVEEIMYVATHADAELNLRGIGKRGIVALMQSAQQSVILQTTNRLRAV